MDWRPPLSTSEKEALIRRMEAARRFPIYRKRPACCENRSTNGRRPIGAMGAAGLNRKRGPKSGERAAVGSVVPPTPARRRAPARRSGRSQGAHRATGTSGRTSAGGPRFFSRSLAILGRETPRERRDHLFAVVEKDDTGSQGNRTGPTSRTRVPARHRASVRDLRAFARQLLSLARTRTSAPRDDAELARSDPETCAASAVTKATGASREGSGTKASSSTPSVCSG